MRPQDTIAKKRDGEELSAAEIGAFIDGVCDGSWADYQISALIMAMVIRGMSLEEQDAITAAMLNSGEVLDLSAIARPKGDKHSTGGVGDKTSLIIAPVVAACGVAVPMISGRGLGHTGGTLDKLESIPGYNVNLTTDDLHRVIDECGFAMAGQTAEIAPADKKIYSLRDATATVPCIPLIVASIMSKKLAEGLDALILDVKTGSGAFMKSLDDSKDLARALVRTGRNFGVKTEAVISDMGQPLGQYVGNAVEIYECLQILRGEEAEGAVSTKELSLELSARLIALCGVEPDLDSARQKAADVLASGGALQRFRHNVEQQGGDVRICDEPSRLLSPNVRQLEIVADRDGFVASVDTLAIGNAVCELGGGRTRAEDTVDHAVGLMSRVRIGDEVRKGESLATIYCRECSEMGGAASMLQEAYHVAESAAQPPVLVSDVVS